MFSANEYRNKMNKSIRKNYSIQQTHWTGVSKWMNVVKTVISVFFSCITIAFNRNRKRYHLNHFYYIFCCCCFSEDILIVSEPYELFVELFVSYPSCLKKRGSRTLTCDWWKKKCELLYNFKHYIASEIKRINQ